MEQRLLEYHRPAALGDAEIWDEDENCLASATQTGRLIDRSSECEETTIYGLPIYRASW